MLACRFVGRRVKPEKPLRSSSLSRPVDTTLVAVGRIARGATQGSGSVRAIRSTTVRCAFLSIRAPDADAFDTLPMPIDRPENRASRYTKRDHDDRLLWPSPRITLGHSA